jgi:hypothetical protein
MKTMADRLARPPSSMPVRSRGSLPDREACAPLYASPSRTLRSTSAMGLSPGLASEGRV